MDELLDACKNPYIPFAENYIKTNNFTQEEGNSRMLLAEVLYVDQH